MDSSYKLLARVWATPGYNADLHDFILTPRGTAFLLIYKRVPWDLSPVGGPIDGAVLDGIIQEVDVRTGEVLFEWHSLDHIPITDSFVPAPKRAGSRYDYFHLNSIDEQPDGDLLISARHTSGVYLIARDTGDVVWQLGGGAASNFALLPGAD